MSLHYSELTLNNPQARFNIVQANESWLFMARGTGKTQGCTAPFSLHKVETMPGSCGALIGQTFTDIESKILKPLFTGFDMMGHKLDESFLYGKKPPTSWKRALIPIIDWSRVIAFPNGTTIQLVSLHQKGSANSNSFQWMIGPEAKYFDEKQLRGEVFPTLRGLVPKFGKSPWYGAKMFETDKYGTDIFWLLEKRKLHDENLVNTVIYYQLQLNELRLKLTEVSVSHGYTIRQQIKQLQTILNLLRKRLVFVGEASAYDNIENLGEEYFENMRRSLTDYEYKIAILNEDPTRAEHNFYPDRTDKNLYISDTDEDVTRPVCVGLDNQASITPLVWCQQNDLVIENKRSLNFLGATYAKGSNGVDVVIDGFCDYYKNRPCKEVIYFYNHTFKAKASFHKPFYEYVIDCYKKHGWKITPVYMGQAPEHEDKYRQINYYLREQDDTTPIRINKLECSHLLVSMDMSEAIQSRKGTEKNKRNERKMNIPQETTTHFSDVFDDLVWSILELDLHPVNTGIRMRLGVS